MGEAKGTVLKKKKDELGIRVTPIFTRITEYREPIILLKGGAGSSKSVSVVQRIIQILLSQSGKELAIVRKFFPSHRTSTMKVFFDMLKEWGLYREENHDKTNNVYRYNGNNVYFLSMGIDESGQEKIKSSNFNYVWMEEATEFGEDDFEQFRLRLRAPTLEGEINQMWLSFNPIDENHWIPGNLIGQKGVAVDHSNYRDNPYLPADYIEYLEGMKERRPNWYRIYVLGEWGQLENLVFPDFKLASSVPDEVVAWGYGLDFGGNVAPTALIQVVFTRDAYYWQQRLFARGLTTQDIIERLSHLPKGPIWADPQFQDRIDEIARAGYEIYRARKGPGSVVDGIDVVRRRDLYIVSGEGGTDDLEKQIKGYARKKDSKGTVLEQPEDGNDDCIDAGRYCTVGLFDRFGSPTQSPDREMEWDEILVV